MPYPVSVKEAVEIENEVQTCIEDAVTCGRLRAAVDILLEYISASLTIDVIDDLQDMLADPEPPLPVPRTPEEWRRVWSKMYPKAAKEDPKE
jgi:hypothetical protein